MTQSRRIDLPPYSFWETRSGAGTPVVLIHGLGGSSDWWRRNIPALVQQHEVAAVDLVGFGKNRPFLRRSQLPLTFEEIAALLSRWIRSTFRSPVHLVGNSMGGHIATHVAARFPDVARSLTLVNSTGIPFEFDPINHARNLIVPAGMLSFAQILARDLLRGGPTSIALAFARLLRDDTRELLRSLRLPVFLLWGDSDPLVPVEYASQILEVKPGARLFVIPRGGHIPMWQNPEVFNRELLSFLAEVDRSTSASFTAQLPFSWGISGYEEGLAYREAGRSRELVLVHGLGMSSLYFSRLAACLHARGIGVVAPDLPGFGASAAAPAMGPKSHAEHLAAWAAKLGIGNAAWAGHSTGCQAVEKLRLIRPELVRRAIFLSPLWTRSRHPLRRLAIDLPIDAFREPLRLYPLVVRAYLRAGLRRWAGTLRRHIKELGPGGDATGAMIAGRRDPLIDRAAIRSVEPSAELDLPGAHAMVFSHPEETAAAIERALRSARSSRA